MTQDLTLQEAIADGLIAMVNAAYGVDQLSFAKLLEDAAFKLSTEDFNRARPSCSGARDTNAQRSNLLTTE